MTSIIKKYHLTKTLDQQLQARPKKVIFCQKCVVSNQRPRITFDEHGVCSACNYAEQKHRVFDWKKREQELWKLLDRYRSKTGNYDCIVPSSGGKDSGYVAHQLKHKYGMHPLTITWAPFLYTDIGWKNYLAFKDSGFDNLLFFPNGKLHRKLAKLAFILHGDAWDPFAYGQKNFAYHMALKFKIKLIFYGENGEAEYGGSLKSATKAYESVDELTTLYYKGSSLQNLLDYGLKWQQVDGSGPDSVALPDHLIRRGNADWPNISQVGNQRSA
jgi:N-acetyl sugar amidotransferase